MKRIKDLRNVMQSYKIDAYIIPSTDEWRNEYTPNHTKRLEWISGFSGSSGILIITKKDLILFTDSRYTAQAKVELSTDFQIIDMHNANAYEIMSRCKGYVVGYDHMIQTFNEIQHYEMLGKKFHFTMQAIDENLVDLLVNTNLIEVEEISEDITSKLRQQITKEAPEFFKNLEDKQQVGSCISFGAKVNGEYIGVVSLLLEYKENAHIYWIGILSAFDRQGIGKSLIDFAAMVVSKRGIETITVDTPFQSAIDFFTAQGFTLLFDVQKMVYMIKNDLSNNKKIHYSEIQNLPIELAGMSVEDKINIVLDILPTECDGVILTSPASICWLLNIRGNDIKYNPLLLCYAILNVQSKIIQLFINTSKSLEISYKLVEFYPLDMFKKYIRQVNHLRLAFDKNNSSVWLANNIDQPINMGDPTVDLRAVKNAAELHGLKQAHIYDGVALCKFWFWLYNVNGTIDEISAAAKLSEFRRMNPEFVEESFGTISGYGSNGAIVHYQSKENTCKSIASEGEDPIYLVDSGAHYSCAGTTDITRVFNMGRFVEGIRDEHKTAYTAILKGHIALARTVFPAGTNGSQLDALARYYLWHKGLDYGHGTGHGVGHFSSVHEGPQGITRNNTVTLKENMVISIEPGYYKEGHFGMRIENLYAVKKSLKLNGFLEFEILTMVPIETSLIDFDEINKDEIEWLENHNRVAIEAVRNKLTQDELEFIISNSAL